MTTKQAEKVARLDGRGHAGAQTPCPWPFLDESEIPDRLVEGLTPVGSGDLNSVEVKDQDLDGGEGRGSMNSSGSMKKSRRTVNFVMSYRDEDGIDERVVLLPERGVQTVNVGVWVAMAALLWLLLVIPMLVI